MEDIRFEGRAGRLGAVMTAVVVDGPKGKGKEYRLPTDHERAVAEVTEEQLEALYADIPFGLPEEQTPKAGIGASRAFSVDGYGFDTWRKLFTNRQLLAIGGFVLILRRLMQELDGWPESWREALVTNLALANDRLADYSSAVCSWNIGREVIRNTFGRFALPIVWDYTEVNPLSDTSGNFLGALDWVSKVCEHLQKSVDSARSGKIVSGSAISCPVDSVDLILTDPPYYDAIPYSDLMDFFYVWLRRSIPGLSAEIEPIFSDALGPKWDHDTDDGELIDDASRFDGDKERSKQNYEDGMARSFRSCHTALQPDGRLVVVFANKHPDAWETLVAALIRAGFVVDGSWPIQTEMGTRTRAMASAALSSSVWIVCKKRPASRPGWDTTVLNEMRDNITQQLRDFWDAGIRGPDFVWAATGPALEAFSKHPVVKKANDPEPTNDRLGVPARSAAHGRRFRRRPGTDPRRRPRSRNDRTRRRNHLLPAPSPRLRHGQKPPSAAASSTPYRATSPTPPSSTSTTSSPKQAKEQPATNPKRTPHPRAQKRQAAVPKSSSNPITGDRAATSASKPQADAPVPLIDQVHKLMHLWRAGDQVKVDDYLDTRGLQRNALFNQILQALIELADTGSDERSILEALSNHVAARGGVQAQRQRELQFGE